MIRPFESGLRVRKQAQRFFPQAFLEHHPALVNLNHGSKHCEFAILLG